jgi:hypothetical protein
MAVFIKKLRVLRASGLSGPVVLKKSNWLAGSLSGPKSPIFRHTSQFFLTVALLWPAKNRFVWRKMGPFLAQTRPANQLRKKNAGAQNQNRLQRCFNGVQMPKTCLLCPYSLFFHPNAPF